MSLCSESDETPGLLTTSSSQTYFTNSSIDLVCHKWEEEDAPIPSFYERYKGQIFMAFASYMFSFAHLSYKLLGHEDITTSQMVLIRSLITTIGCFVCFQFSNYGSFLGPSNLRYLLTLRGLLGSLGMTFFILSVQNLNLGDAVALSFTIPIFMVLLAAIILNEPFSRYDLLSIILGICGVCFICQPEFFFGSFFYEFIDDKSKLAIGVMFSLASTVTNGFGNVLVRKMGNDVHFMQIITYLSIIPIIPNLIMSRNELGFVFSFSWWTLLIFCFMSLTGFLGQVFFSLSLQVETVSKVTPLLFLQVIFAFFNDWFFFNVNPPIWSLSGSLFIASSVYISTLSK